MDFLSVCRTCLRTDSLNPIFKSKETHEEYSSTIYLGTGLQVKFNDDLPQNMCTPCVNQLNNTLKFRQQCLKVENKLLRIQSELNSMVVESTVIIGSDMKHCTQTASRSEVTTIKTELNDIYIKSELTDNDEDKPLKFLITKEFDILPKNNDLVSTSNEILTINTAKSNDTVIDDYFNEEPNLYDNDEDYVTEYKGLKHIDIVCEDITNSDVKTSLKKTNTKKNKQENLLKSKDTLNFNNTKVYKKNSPNTEPTIEMPYNVITDSVTNKTTRVVCKLCQKELSIRSIDSHMARRHPGADQRKVKCELCDKYVMKDKLNRHKVMMHGTVGFRCGYCKTDFESKAMLLEHIKTCTPKKRKRKANESGRELAECDVCKMTMQKASLRMHKAVKHAGLRPVCEHCGRSFGNKFRLNEHYRAKHGYEKFQCSYCDFRSAGIMAMRNHERRHRDEKPFVCETCGAKFHAAYLLTQHRHSHRTEKLVKCPQCPARFKAPNSLHMHKLTCHSRSLYRCTLCARSYKCRYYAAKHARLAHAGAVGMCSEKMEMCSQ